MVTVVTLNAQGQWTHRMEIPEGHAIPDGYVLYVDQPAVPDAWRDFQAAVLAGYAVPGHGFTLALGDEDRAQFTQMLSLIGEGLDLQQMTDETPVSIADQSGAMHEVTVLQFRQIMLGYGLHYKGLWDAAKASET